MSNDAEDRLRRALSAAGSEGNFWERVARAGTPWIDETADGQVEMTLLHRHEDTDIPFRVYVDAGSLTDHHAPALATMTRVEDTDIWFWSTLVTRTWRGAYRFMPVAEDVVDEFDPPGITETTAGVRSRFLGLLDHAVADPFNPRKLDRASLAEMPDAPLQRWWNDDDSETPGKVRESLWESQLLGNVRSVWIHEAGSTPALPDRPLVVILDGRQWIEQHPLAPVLDRAVAAGAMPPAVVVFVDSLDFQTRGRELPCSTAFWEAMIGELIPQVAEHTPCTCDPRRTVVAGQSYGGLAAVFAGLEFPERFGLVSSQSGSFWWPVMSHADQMGPPGGRIAELLRNTEPVPSMTVAMTVGRHEGDMPAHNRAVAELLRERGSAVTFDEFNGGHEWVCWRGELVESLIALLA
ncbi:Enterochelin esterase [Rhodococcus sp. AW25M09]|uniref:enterochelin esterase n=1 Tax=Rhodococcus sp. AW25M09 TaxID=1268303 RepID=UPI0002AC3456|nr:enterochelin esterase [Rhodococcus sp. AW25M09]CCQ14145.1 Enterochelin esterase [Rhodococcus sp. AW25M09]